MFSNYRTSHPSWAPCIWHGVLGRGMGIILIELSIWDVLGYERRQDGPGEHLQRVPGVQPSQLGNWCQLDLGLAVGHKWWGFWVG